MENDFSFLDTQLLWQLMKKHTGEEIASLMERPLSQVQEKIRELTGEPVSPGERQLLQKRTSKAPGAPRRQAGRGGRQKKSVSRPPGTIVAVTGRTAARAPARKPQPVPFPTRVVDYSLLVPVCLHDAHKTVIYVRRQEEAESARESYWQRQRAKRLLLKVRKTTTRVSNFKPARS
ncbi:hypothetical protein V9K67_24555 [Paraflavisolibacter sp. H34]|uniref:hypothetical protein n=1 Tax=Huijunlia imazamoxiresistens TaxID=3127457 RepID=UPI003016A914